MIVTLEITKPEVEFIISSLLEQKAKYAIPILEKIQSQIIEQAPKTESP